MTEVSKRESYPFFSSVFLRESRTNHHHDGSRKWNGEWWSQRPSRDGEWSAPCAVVRSPNLSDNSDEEGRHFLPVTIGVVETVKVESTTEEVHRKDPLVRGTSY